ncbi:hypothetical protein Q671_11350 [Halomonas sp. PBN3]|nr:hypothetical protein Q671_11350 [Halomonas sp. PBN3]
MAGERPKLLIALDSLRISYGRPHEAILVAEMSRSFGCSLEAGSALMKLPT